MLLDSDVQIATIAAYNFSIAYENSVIDVRVLACSRVSREAPSSLHCAALRPSQHYVTEKLLDPLLVGSIPLYFGTTMASEIVNAECFINALVLSTSPLQCTIQCAICIVDRSRR
jgi:hypothetical protein